MISRGHYSTASLEHKYLKAHLFDCIQEVRLKQAHKCCIHECLLHFNYGDLHEPVLITGLIKQALF